MEEHQHGWGQLFTPPTGTPIPTSKFPGSGGSPAEIPEIPWGLVSDPGPGEQGPLPGVPPDLSLPNPSCSQACAPHLPEHTPFSQGLPDNGDSGASGAGWGCHQQLLLLDGANPT